MTIEQIMAEMQQASRKFAAGYASAESAAASLRAVGRSMGLACLGMPPSLARLHRKSHEEYEAKLAADRIEAHRRTASNGGESR